MDAAGFRRHLPRPPHAAQLFSYRQSRLQTVLVKSGAEICATKPDSAGALQAPEPTLGADRSGIKNWMLVGFAAQQRAQARCVRRIQGDKVIGLAWQALQSVHPVGDAGQRGLGAGAPEIVPAGPHGAAAWHQRGVGMQHGNVASVAEGAQHVTLARRSLRPQQGERLVGMAGQHDVVIHMRASAAVHPHALLQPSHCQHRAAGANTAGKAFGQLRDVFAAATGHSAPCRAFGDLQQAMIVAEADEGGGRVQARVGGRTGPNRSRHRQQMVLLQCRAITAFAQILVQAA